MQDILNKLFYWYTVEKFSSFNVEYDRNSYFNKLPWIKEKKNKHYEVYLGLYNNSDVIGFLADKYGDKDNLPERVSGISCLGIFNVDENGEYIENTFKISMLPYVINELLSDNIKTTNSSLEFDNLTKIIEGTAINVLKKVNYATVNEMLSKLLKHFGWFNENWFSKMGKFKIEERSIGKESNQDEEDKYFNSFYLSDIEKLIVEANRKNYGSAFKNFILQYKSNNRVDIENDRKYIEDILQPNNIPMAKWPSKYGLSLMQQVSVNLALKELKDSSDIFSVNGPPGTGKTTLLRDVIANIIVDRAKKLSNYDKPENAFKKANEVIKVTMKNGVEYPYNPYIIDDELKGYGITIVSNNNNAVENISKELPEMKAINGFDDCLGADYFRDTASKVSGLEAWGLISATLGKKNNCSEFSKNLWGGGFSEFANQINSKNESLNWEQEKEKFLNAYEEIENYKEELNELKNAIEEEKNTKDQIENINNKINMRLDAIGLNDIKYKLIKEAIEDVENRIEVFKEIIKCHKENQPSLFIRIFRRKVYKQYNSELQKHNLDKKEALTKLLDLKNDLDSSKNYKNKLEKEKNEFLNEMSIYTNKLDEIIRIKEKWNNKIGSLYPEKYWDKTIDDQQLECLWITKDLDEKRCELFLLALQLHKAFILNVHQPLKSNLSIFTNYLSGNELQGNYLRYINDLWNTLFLIVPVVSSPFASIGRMYKHLGKEEIGWLLIDEAGQALPQTALGAIWRSKRVVVVGDPLQVEPVATIPLTLIELIGKEWNVEDVVSKTLSVQKMADKINKYGTYREDLWIGCPLRVHRRCENPMFKISNKIAYDNKMIYGTFKNNTYLPIRECRWIDCIGRSKGGKSHYIEEQGEAVCKLIKQCMNDGGELPELYVISPFKTVVGGIKYKIKKEFNFVEPKILTKWINKSIGTVHTFQGKEAGMVIICLGVDKDHEGAVRWASKSPNILNVAVTRAKNRLVIVGDKELWGDKPNFKEALEALSIGKS
ncbi:DEAD/DEAH box helicase [Clostridium saccharobutylicum]|uniref:DNA2/NAM7 helicase-like C-terminal domain-containing protein n=1 Tax=Clostridium saccharobutylicum DSM 13864 TaxID=1345695 RepID=U5MT49_CLOSA|nr:ATP-binding protein [Clostridium saccharobutylicum]AGX43924.1 hypothetical protein CLSA_c29570 [Clostridium saccharobutylicum DSM 13864]AQS01126.1 ATP-dependent RecD-like DNA helicase [Clostridium saccharobutylicum]AQS15109.1 ATP-dependent RecD-like DNA helicase [Clostridium saccharobutylicum]MBA2905235.1 hypothetical protein [Clostridium saccharobutylicum]MBA8789808.1 hypothetical protein [Clostridium saccharobutylicum]